MSKKKILAGAGIALVIVIFVVLALRRERTGGTEVRTEAVQRRDLVAIVTSSGRIRPHRSVDIQADVSGRIVALRVDEGDLVERGDTLLIIDRTAFEAAVQRARAGLSSARASAAQAKANLDQAERALRRTRRLKEQNPELISDEQLESAQTNFDVQSALYEAAQHQVEQADAGLREALDRLSKTVITAPMAGRVTRLNVDEGETAIVGTMNNPGTVLLTIGDLAEMEAVIEVDETDLPEIKLGDSTTVQIDAFPNQTFTGRVTEIASSSIQGSTGALSGRTSDQSVDFEVVVRLDRPPPALRPDLSATAEVVTATRDSALSIPIIALTLRPQEEREEPRGDRPGQTIPLGNQAEQDEEGVFVVGEDRTIEFRPVAVGIAGRDYFEVLDGLREGEIIVAGSYQAIRQLEEGDLVKIESGPAPGEPATREASAAEPSEDVIEASTGAPDATTGAAASAATPEAAPETGSLDPAATDEPNAGRPADAAASLPYSVLIASFRSYEDAIQRRDAWAGSDMLVYVAPTTIDGETFNRVFAGALPDRDRATELMGRLAEQGIKDQVRDWDVRPTRLAFLLGTYSSAADAETRVAELREAGIPAYVLPSPTGSTPAASTTTYRVYAGGYERAEDAPPLVERLESQGVRADLVERIGSVPGPEGVALQGATEEPA